MDRKFEIEKFRLKLKNGNPSIGSWMQIPHPSIAEIMADANFDWIVLDMEHGQISNSQLPDLLRSIELKNTLGLVRILENNKSNCKQALDAGAAGIISPMVETKSDIVNLINNCKWPPSGTRGVAYSRANLFGKYFNKYIEEAQDPIVIAMIESIKGINNMEDILSVSGLDAILLGPYDLSASLKITAQFENEIFKNAVSRFKSISQKYNLPYGIHVVDPCLSKLKNTINEGYQFIPFSIDGVFLSKAIIHNI